MINNLSECDARILAMALDCEGGIGLEKNKKVLLLTNIHYSPRVYFTNTSYELVVFIRKLVGDETREIRNNYDNKRKKEHKTAYIIMWETKEDIIEILSQIKQYLICKKEQAELLIEFCFIRQEKLKKDYHASYGMEEHILFDDIRKLNKKGIDLGGDE